MQCYVVIHGIKWCIYFVRNGDVDKFNSDKLNALSSRNVLVVADEEIVTNEGLKAEEERDARLHAVQYNILKDADFWKDCIAAGEINLKVGAQVWLNATHNSTFLQFLTINRSYLMWYCNFYTAFCSSKSTILRWHVGHATAELDTGGERKWSCQWIPRNSGGLEVQGGDSEWVSGSPERLQEFWEKDLKRMKNGERGLEKNKKSTI